MREPPRPSSLADEIIIDLELSEDEQHPRPLQQPIVVKDGLVASTIDTARPYVTVTPVFNPQRVILSDAHFAILKTRMNDAINSAKVQDLKMYNHSHGRYRCHKCPQLEENSKAGLANHLLDRNHSIMTKAQPALLLRFPCLECDIEAGARTTLGHHYETHHGLGRDKN